MDRGGYLGWEGVPTLAGGRVPTLDGGTYLGQGTAPLGVDRRTPVKTGPSPNSDAGGKKGGFTSDLWTKW